MSAELDRAVAEKLGWKWQTRLGYRAATLTNHGTNEYPQRLYGSLPDGYTADVIQVPHYSTDLNLAMGAVSNIGLTLKLLVMPSGTATAQLMQAGFVVGCAEDLPPAEAICRAIVG